MVHPLGDRWLPQEEGAWPTERSLWELAGQEGTSYVLSGAAQEGTSYVLSGGASARRVLRGHL